MDPSMMRASDAERERTAAALQRHAVAGRLDFDELSDRCASAYRARTRGELAALTADLPATYGDRAPVPAQHTYAAPGWSAARTGVPRLPWTLIAAVAAIILIWLTVAATFGGPAAFGGC